MPRSESPGKFFKSPWIVFIAIPFFLAAISGQMNQAIAKWCLLLVDCVIVFSFYQAPPIKLLTSKIYRIAVTIAFGALLTFAFYLLSITIARSANVPAVIPELKFYDSALQFDCNNGSSVPVTNVRLKVDIGGRTQTFYQGMLGAGRDCESFHPKFDQETVATLYRAFSAKEWPVKCEIRFEDLAGHPFEISYEWMGDNLGNIITTKAEPKSGY